MPSAVHASRKRGAPAFLSAFVLLNVFMGSAGASALLLLPTEGSNADALPSSPAAAARVLDPGLRSGSVDPEVLPAVNGAPTPALEPLALGVGTPENWSPYSPSAFTYGKVGLSTGASAVNFTGVPSFTVNQTGNVNVMFNGSWNPRPLVEAERDWVMVVFVANGRADVFSMEANTSRAVTLGAAQLPATAYFALPSPRGFSSGVSSASVAVTPPSGTSTRVNLTIAAAGLDLQLLPTVQPVASKSLWTNSSGLYSGNGVLSGPQNTSVLVPFDDTPPLPVHRGEVREWTSGRTFPGGRLFLLNGGGGIVVIGNIEVSVWTRGSPESGLYVNATLAPLPAFRGSTLQAQGSSGNRSLLQSTNWSVNTTAQAAPAHQSTSCTAMVRLTNGSFRLFCRVSDTILLNTTYGVASAFSRDGSQWNWEPGLRYQPCAGAHSINEIAIIRMPDGVLKMYYGGQGTLISCPGALATHISAATSDDEGVTWSLDSETLGNFAVTAPDVRAVVSTQDGVLRMYLDSSSGLATATSEDTDAWSGEAVLGGTLPRTVYALSDGSYKMYFGTTDVQSSRSLDGFTWTAVQTELGNWAGAIEAGPVIDRGDGTLGMLVYSQASGLFLATLRGATTPPARLLVLGTSSDGRPFGAALANVTSAGVFLANLSLPATAPIGRTFAEPRAWYGGPRVRTIVLNRLPVWSGPKTINATEDVPYVLNLANLTADLDAADSFNFTAVSAYAVLLGSSLTLTYPNGVLSDTVNGSVHDGWDFVFFKIAVNVTPVNDAPTISPNASYTAVEDSPSPVDFAAAVFDQDTPLASLTVTTDAPNATAAGTVVTFRYNLPGSYQVNLSVSDGALSANATTMIIVTPVDDPPVLTLLPLYTGTEDSLVALDLQPAVYDEDTPFNNIDMTTNLSGASVNRFNITLTPSLPGSFSFSVTLDDGTTQVSGSSVLQVLPVNDPPVWSSFEIRDLTEDVPAEFDVAPFITDEDNATATLVFSVVSPNATFNGSVLEMLFGEGITDVTLQLRVSDGTSVRFNAVRVRINSVNDPPMLTGTPPSASQGGGPVTYQFGASDPDNTLGFTFSLVTGPAWLSVSPSGLLTVTPPQGLHGRADYTARVQDAAGAFSLPVTFNFTLPANTLPEMRPNFTGLPADAFPGVQFWFDFGVFDADGDPLSLSAVWDDPAQNVTLTDLGSNVFVLRWTPNYTYDPTSDFGRTLTGTLKIDDSFGFSTYPFAFRARDPANRPPTINGTIGPINVTRNNSTEIDLTPFMDDPDDSLANLTWAYNATSVPFVSVFYNPSNHHLTVLFVDTGNGLLILTLADPGHKNVSVPVTVHATEPQAPGGEQPNAATGFPWWLLLVLAAAGAGAGLYLWRRSRAARAASAAVEEVPIVPPEAAPAAPILAPAAPARPKRTFLVEDLFLLYRDGRTIYTRGGLSADAVEDAESVGAMLVAVQDFVKDSFRRGSPVDRMGYGDNVILIEQGDYALLAVTVFGDPDREFRELLAETVRKVEMTYAGVIEKWDGSKTALKGVEAILAPIWQLTADLTRGDVLLATTAREVQMLSGVEFFQGFVRLKVGIVNNTSSVITNVTVDLDFNADVLRLHKIEPAGYKSAAAKVSLGVLQAGEKSTLAYYFDPQICTSSAIDGSCRYKDHEGRQHIVQMKSRQAEVVCPLFFTKEQANTAMLKRLVETEVKMFDVRAYSFKPGPADVALNPLFEAMKSAVMAHDVQLVRSFERRRPYVGEAWFYGKTKVKGYQMVIRAVVDQEKGRAEFFVASSAMRSVTGLLAELNHTFQASSGGRFAELGLTALFEEHVRDAYSDPRAVSKMLEGEVDAAENEPA